jgi:hypothetical protein
MSSPNTGDSSQQAQQTPLDTHDAEWWEADAQLTWDVAVFNCEIRFTPKELRDKGNFSELVFSQLKRTMELENYEATDFNFKEMNSAERKKQYAQDLTKSITLVNFTTNYPHKFLIQCNVPKFKNEGFNGGSQYVNKTIMPFTLSATQPKTVVLLNRPISRRILAFLNDYPDTLPEMLHTHMKTIDDRHVLVPLSSAIVTVHNNKYAERPDKQLTAESKGLSSKGMVQMSRRRAEEYIETAKKSLTKEVSLGKITNGLEITFSTVQSPEQFDKHKDFNNGNVKGQEHLGFADPFHSSVVSHKVMRTQVTAEEREKFDNTSFYFIFQAEVQYKKLNGKAIKFA